MRFTDEPAPPRTAGLFETLQVFSVRVAGRTEAGAGAGAALRWPLDVFGLVAVDECQTLTEEDPYLELTGPTRAGLLDCVVVEAALKVKGATESDDSDLSFLAVPMMRQSTLASCLLIGGEHSSKLSTLEVKLGHIVFSVEATILVRVVGGSWPDGIHGLFAARTASIEHEEIVLLRSKDNKRGVVVAGDGIVRLSRSVASVEVEEELKVSVRAWAAYFTGT
ncbi:hypothetical protein GQ55_3G160100 [Panicum hallii var. hallii]|uniref:DUF6598 domain-containing protein n=1 Tax=Panicum hallii var. hallii TaxID=1504633 RepID=A0A2T7EA15_9POAL|nr:hypothetical protein GQ55_3G160100 [Panicum hallii var. hallii]